MSKPRLLTKSRFKIGLGCPTKLFYTNKSKEWANKSLDDPFLIELAKGGYQVGELSKCYYPDGIEVKELDYEISWNKTKELLKRENVTIFEAAIRFENLFVRVDILNKIGNRIEIIEVKSKSFSSSVFKDDLWDKRKLKKDNYSLKSDWKDYILDIAFQTYVFKKTFPQFSADSFLFCPDKEKKSTVDGLNQKFKVKETKKSSYEVIINGEISKQSLGDAIMEKVNISDEVEIIINDRHEIFDSTKRNFTESIAHLAEAYEKDQFLNPEVGTKCKSCEFRCDSDGLKNGFNNCWELQGVKNLNESFVFDIWNFRGADKLISENIYQVSQLEEDDIIKKPNPNPEMMDVGTRQWLQVEKEIQKDDLSTYCIDGLAEQMSKWVFPLHMIDFETSRVAIPFLKNKRPYEQIAFQFSHHIIYEDGMIAHQGQFIETKASSFPNFNFVRALKKELDKDSGSIFMYHHHEQNVLYEIISQLESSNEKDKDDLISFIKSITTKKSGKEVLWSGQRTMIDLCDLVKKYYYNPLTKNSNSIKAVLPAILSESELLQNKYSKEVYGKKSTIKSLNFEKMKWLVKKDGEIQDPYKMLDSKLFSWNYSELEEYMSDPTINNGGAAMVAYAVLQFFEISDSVRESIEASLLRYCELDTLAMVFIWEHWNNLIKEQEKRESA